MDPGLGVVQGRCRPPPPTTTTTTTTTTRVTTKQIMVERVDLYRHVTFPGWYFSVGMTPFPVEGYVLNDEDITREFRRLILNRSRGPLVMQAEHPC